MLDYAVSVSAPRSVFGAVYDYYIAYLVAHLLTHLPNQNEADAGTLGPVTQRSTGAKSIGHGGHGSVGGNPLSKVSLMSTTYGQEVQRIRDSRIAKSFRLRTI